MIEREVPGVLLDGVGVGGHDIEISGVAEEAELEL